jgi:A/G-specific adenine glycosylase
MTLADNAIAWYDANARDLPWRASGTTAWGVLVSEVMLQQTPVARVEPAWRSWMTRWPTPGALASDPPADAIRMWGRLGYPRRALRLHECATVITAAHSGCVPSELEALLALPGIGTYTARAVAAFAYRQRHPVVDTNVRRLVARAVAGAPDAGPTTTTRDLSAVDALLPADPALAAHTSVAFMELGALICTARSPRCAECPIMTVCAFRASGASLPTGPTRRPQGYAGTDRQVRGMLLAVLREATEPVSRTRLDVVWADAAQRSRALSGLVSDGLVREIARDMFVLP